ncbi:unnamed protein product [Lampetra planeri]
MPPSGTTGAPQTAIDISKRWRLSPSRPRGRHRPRGGPSAASAMPPSGTTGAPQTAIDISKRENPVDLEKNPRDHEENKHNQIYLRQGRDRIDNLLYTLGV